MKPGRFISFEGGEGCGKSTQARLLAEWLEEQGRSVMLTREPGGTPGAEAIRQLVLAPPADGWTAEAEALLFAAARADHVARVIKPALAEGRWVICDRFIDSSLAYQGVASGLGLEAVRQLHQIGSGGLLPSLTLLLEVGATEAARRVRQRDLQRTDAIEERSEAYHQRVVSAFNELAREDPDRFVVIDSSGPVAQVQEQVRQAVLPLLKEVSA